MKTLSQNLINLLIVYHNDGFLDFKNGQMLPDDVDEAYQTEDDYNEIINIGWAKKSSHGGSDTRIEMTPFGEKIIKEIFDVCKKFTQQLK